MEATFSLLVSFASVSIALLSLALSYFSFRIARRQEKRRDASFLTYIKGSSQYWLEESGSLVVELDVNASNLSDAKHSIEFFELILKFDAESGYVVPIKIPMRIAGSDRDWMPQFFDAGESRNLALTASVPRVMMPENSVITGHQFLFRVANGLELTQDFEPFDAKPIFKN